MAPQEEVTLLPHSIGPDPMIAVGQILYIITFSYKLIIHFLPCIIINIHFKLHLRLSTLVY